MSYCPTLSPRGNGQVYPPVPHWRAVPGLELVLFHALVFTPGANPDNRQNQIFKHPGSPSSAHSD